MDFLELVKKRYSTRSYLDKPVEKEKLDYIIECARLAPSAVNLQPWHFKVLTAGNGLSEIKECYKREWINTAPCIIVVCTNHKESWHRRADNKDFADVDAAIATEHICLAATELGLGCCWVCNFNAEQCSAKLGLEEEVEPIALIPIGYPADLPNEKKRKSTTDILF